MVRALSQGRLHDRDRIVAGARRRGDRVRHAPAADRRLTPSRFRSPRLPTSGEPFSGANRDIPTACGAIPGPLATALFQRLGAPLVRPPDTPRAPSQAPRTRAAARATPHLVGPKLWRPP